MSKKNFDLKLTGYVGDWTFRPSDVERLLSRCAGREVNVLIDSTGGSLAAGLSISAEFARHGNVAVHFVGMNASAATVASMGAARITIDRGAMYLVHQSSLAFFTWGSMNADELDAQIKEYQKAKADLEKIDLHMAAVYARRCKKPVQDLLEVMKTGAWLTPEEALEWGFVDEITDFSEDKPARLHEAEAIAMSKAGIPLPNMPIVADSWRAPLERIEKALTDLFKKKPINSIEMKKNYENICALLACQDVEITDEGCSLTEANLDKIESRLAECVALMSDKDSEIESLKAEIENLKKEPAAETSAVVEDSKAAPEAKSEMEAFMETVNSARDTFKALS